MSLRSGRRLRRARNSKAIRRGVLKGRRPLVEMLESREMLTADPPRILGLSAGNAAIYEGNTFSLSATGVDDPNGTTPIANVKFYQDSDFNGQLNVSTDTLLGTVTSGSSGTWTLASIATGGANPVVVGDQLFFARATNSASQTSNAIALPTRVLTSAPVVEPVDNDTIVVGRRYVLSPQADLPPGVNHDFTYNLTFVTDTHHSSAPTTYTFDTDSGALIWDPVSGDASAYPYHFQITATDTTTSVTSVPYDFYLTVSSTSQDLSPGGAPFAGPLGYGPYDIVFYVSCSCQPMGSSVGTGSVGNGNGGNGGPVLNSMVGSSSGGWAGNGLGGAPPLTNNAGSPPADSASTPPFVNTLNYGAATNPHPIIELDVPVSAMVNTTAAYVSAQAQILPHNGGTALATSSIVYYTMAGVASGRHFHLALPVDASTIATGDYQTSITLQYYNSSGVAIGGGSGAQVIDSTMGLRNSSLMIVNRNSSPLGKRWDFDNLQSLVLYTTGSNQGAMLYDPSGMKHWFDYDTFSQTYSADASVNLKLEKVSTNYKLISPDGSYNQFDSTGRLTAKVDRLGNSAGYAYYGPTDTTTGHKPNALASITDHSGRSQTFLYNTNGMISTITDFAGRVTTLTYSGSGDQLAQITKDDGSTQSYTYNSDGLLDSQTNALGQKTYFYYDNFRRLERTVFPDGTSEIVQSTETANMAQRVVVDYNGSTPITLGSSIFNPLNSSQVIAAPLFPWNFDALGGVVHMFQGAVGRIVDRDGNITHYGVDHTRQTSFVTQPVVSDPTASWTRGATTFYTHDSNTHLLTSIVAPSPTGSGSEITTYVYPTYNPANFETNYNLLKVVPPGFASFLPQAEYSYVNPDAPTDPNPLHLVYKVTKTASLTDIFETNGSDPNRVTTFEYYSNGLLHTVTDDVTSIVLATYTYTDNSVTGIPAGLVASVTDANGNETKYEYYSAAQSTTDLGNLAAAGRLKSVTLAYGTTDAATTTYKYDADGNVSQQIDPGTRTTNFAYDTLGRLTQAQLRGYFSSQTAGPTWQFTYDAIGQLIRENDANNNRKIYQYDLSNRLAVAIDPNPSIGGQWPGAQTITRYNGAGQATSQIDQLGRWTEYTYDARDRMITLTKGSPTTGLIDSGATETHYTYNHADKLIEVEDANSNVLTYTYTSMGFLRRIESSEIFSDLVTYYYNGFGEVRRKDVPSAYGMASTDYLYDSQGRLEFLYPIDPDSSDSTYDLDPDLHFFYQYEYDAGGRLISQTAPSPDGTPAGLLTEYTYDHQNRRTSTIEPSPDGTAASPTTTYGYDNTNFLYTTMTDPVGNVTTWNYDNFGRIGSQTMPIGLSGSTVVYGTRDYDYDGNGNLTQYTDMNNRVTQYVFDALGRMTTEKWYTSGALSRTLNYAYDKVGNLTSTNDPSASYTYTLDKQDRHTSTLISLAGHGTTVTLANQLDPVGNRTQLAATIGSTADFVNDYEYDDLNRLIGIEQHGVTGGNAVSPKQVGMSLYDSGEINWMNRYNQTGVSNPDAYWSYIDYPWDPASPISNSIYYRDAGGRLYNQYDQQADPTTYYITQTWDYDQSNRLTDYYNSHDGTSTLAYDYDNNHQLTTAGSTTYAYDAAGNRTSGGSGTIKPGNRITNDGTRTYEYDNEGNVTKITVIATGAYQILNYDHRNRLYYVSQHTSGGAIVSTMNYQYDTMNHMVSRTKVVPEPNGGEGNDWVSTEEKFIYDGDHVVMDFYQPDGASHRLQHRYLYGNDVHQILAQENVQIGNASATALASNDRVYWMLTDHLGSVKQLLDKEGNLVSGGQYKYDGFGQVTLGNTALTSYLYTASYRDNDTKEIYNHNRWYDPQAGKWLSQDPIGFSAGDYNLTRYVGNSPTNLTDPSGLQVAVGGAIGGAGTIGGTIGGVGTGVGSKVIGAAGPIGACISVGYMGYQLGNGINWLFNDPGAQLVNWWYGPVYAAGAYDPQVQAEIDKVLGKIADVEDEIAGKLACDFGYGKHDVSGSMQHLQELLKQLGKLMEQKKVE